MISDLVTGVALVIVVGLALRLATLRQRIRDLNRRLTSAELLACTDTLTGLANRGGLHRALAETLQVRGDLEVAVLLLDLDRLKSINDQHGHATGDAVLVEIARRIARQSAAVASAARLGGDEYVIVLAPSRNADVTRYAEDYARALQRDISSPLVVDDMTLRVTASVGIAVLSSADTEQLLAAADQAMYRAKYTGAGICRYHPKLDGPAPVTPAPRASPGTCTSTRRRTRIASTPACGNGTLRHVRAEDAY